MKPWKNDVAVLCIFFARPEQFKECFRQVKLARPRTLLLWQDGPRDNRVDDLENIQKCREIAEDIDWECKVYKNYHEKNMGCDPSTHLSHKWAFSIVDKCIILEDDIVVDQSFFPFCKELLDKYEYDERIDRICGHTVYGGIPDKRYSYFFSKNGASWGWATWKRVADTWESDYEFLNDNYYLDLAHKRFNHPAFKANVKKATQHAVDGVAYWEYVVGFRTLLNSGLVIYPKNNMVKNVGASINATHSVDNINELPKDVQQMFLTPVVEMEFPLKHPPYIIDDYHYFDNVMKHLRPGFCKSILQKVERIFRKIYFMLKRLINN